MTAIVDTKDTAASLPRPSGRAIAACGLGGGLFLAIVLILPLALVALALLTIIGIALLLRSKRDSAEIVVVYIVAMAAIPASLVIPALGSLGTPQILMGLAALGVWVVTWLAPSQLALDKFRPVPLLIVAFVSVNLVSYVAACLRPTDVLERTAADRGIITVAAAAGVGLLAAEGISTMARMEAVLKAVVVAVAAIAAVGIFQFTTGIDPVPAISLPGFTNTVQGHSLISERSMFRRVSGTTAHAIEFSAVLCIALPLAVHLLRRYGWRWLTPVALIGVALPMSVSRTAAVGLAAGALVIVPSWPRWIRRKAYLAAAAYLVIMRLAVPGLLGTIKSLFVDASADPSVQSRQNDYDFVQTFIDQRPWFGRGYATFIPTRYDFLDNQYLLSVVETGFFGAAMYIMLLGGCILTAWSVRLRSNSPLDRDLAQALIASLAVVAATSMAFDLLSFPTVRSMAFLAIGLVGALWRLTSEARQVAGSRVISTPRFEYLKFHLPSVDELQDEDEGDSPRLLSLSMKNSRPRPPLDPRLGTWLPANLAARKRSAPNEQTYVGEESVEVESE